MSRRAETLAHRLLNRSTGPSYAKSSGRQTGLEDTLQKEYITNLQQQIYFLELELRLLKEGHGPSGKSPASASAATTAGRGAAKKTPAAGEYNPRAHEPFRPARDGDFEEHMREARIKYEALEQQYEQQLEELQKAVDEAAIAKDSALAELTRERERVADLGKRERTIVADHEAEKTRTLRTEIDLRKRAERAEAALGQRCTELDQAKERNRTDRVEGAVAVQGLRDELAALRDAERRAQAEASKATDRALDLEKKLVELEERFRIKFGDGGNATGDERGGAAEVEELRMTIKKLELELSAAEAADTRRQAQCQAYLKEIADLKVALTTVNERVAREESRAADTSRSQARWSDELVSLRHRLHTMESLRVEDQRLIEAQAKQITNLRRELATASDERDDVVNENACVKTDLAALRDEVDKLDARNSQLLAENRVLTETCEARDATIASLQEAAETATKERVAAMSRVAHMQKQVELHQSVEVFKRADLQGLVNSNLQMVRNLESIASKMQVATVDDLDPADNKK